MLVATVIFFLIAYRWYHICLIIHSHQFAAHDYYIDEGIQFFFIVLGLCFIFMYVVLPVASHI
jgi:hypothetical protein